MNYIYKIDTVTFSPNVFNTTGVRIIDKDGQYFHKLIWTEEDLLEHTMGYKTDFTPMGTQHILRIALNKLRIYQTLKAKNA